MAICPNCGESRGDGNSEGDSSATQTQDNSNGNIPVPTSSSSKIIIGVVTKLQPGASYGLISEEVYFRISLVKTTTTLKLGDKVVVETDPKPEDGKGMPFRYKAKSVTKIDIDLTNIANPAKPKKSTHTIPIPNINAPAHQNFQFSNIDGQNHLHHHHHDDPFEELDPRLRNRHIPPQPPPPQQEFLPPHPPPPPPDNFSYHNPQFDFPDSQYQYQADYDFSYEDSFEELDPRLRKVRRDPPPQRPMVLRMPKFTVEKIKSEKSAKSTTERMLNERGGGGHGEVGEFGIEEMDSDPQRALEFLSQFRRPSTTNNPESARARKFSQGDETKSPHPPPDRPPRPLTTEPKNMPLTSADYIRLQKEKQILEEGGPEAAQAFRDFLEHQREFKAKMLVLKKKGWFLKTSMRLTRIKIFPPYPGNINSDTLPPPRQAPPRPPQPPSPSQPPPPWTLPTIAPTPQHPPPSPKEPPPPTEKDCEFDLAKVKMEVISDISSLNINDGDGGDDDGGGLHDKDNAVPQLDKCETSGHTSENCTLTPHEIKMSKEKRLQQKILEEGGPEALKAHKKEQQKLKTQKKFFQKHARKEKFLECLAHIEKYGLPPIYPSLPPYPENNVVEEGEVDVDAAQSQHLVYQHMPPYKRCVACLSVDHCVTYCPYEIKPDLMTQNMKKAISSRRLQLLRVEGEEIHQLYKEGLEKLELSKVKNRLQKKEEKQRRRKRKREKIRGARGGEFDTSKKFKAEPSDSQVSVETGKSKFEEPPMSKKQKRKWNQLEDQTKRLSGKWKTSTSHMNPNLIGVNPDPNPFNTYPLQNFASPFVGYPDPFSSQPPPPPGYPDYSYPPYSHPHPPSQYSPPPQCPTTTPFPPHINTRPTSPNSSISSNSADEVGKCYFKNKRRRERRKEKRNAENGGSVAGGNSSSTSTPSTSSHSY